jgi:hypothetical protein
MSRLIPQGDMSAQQLISTSYDLLAMLHIVQIVADAAEGGSLSPNATASVARLMTLATELHAPLHDALERHEGVRGGGK